MLKSNTNLSKINESETIKSPTRMDDRARKGMLDIDILFDLYFLLELLVMFGLGWACAELYVDGHLGDIGYFSIYLPYLMTGPVFVGVMLSFFRCYKLETINRFSACLDKIILSVFFGFTILIAIGFAFQIDNDISRVWIAIWSASTLIFFLLSRVIAARVLGSMAASNIAVSTMAIYGDRQPTQNLISEIRRARPNTDIVGVFGPADKSLASGQEGQWDGDIEALLEFGRTHKLDTIVIANAALDPAVIRELLVKFSVLPSEVLVSFGFERGHIPIRAVHALEESQLLEVQRKPIAGWGRIFKAVLDYVIAISTVVVLAPLLALIALAVKLDSSGPVFFRQRRHGLNNRIFSIWKFRTMTVMEDGDRAVQAQPGDARVTRVGRFLRRTSLDELPQLFNVLAGEMSIVGPRPHPLSLNFEFQTLLTKYENRHVVKPGITGWAQINGYRGPTVDTELMRRRVELDLDYIENWSPWMDTKIIAATPFTLIFGKNAV